MDSLSKTDSRSYNNNNIFGTAEYRYLAQQYLSTITTLQTQLDAAQRQLLFLLKNYNIDLTTSDL